MKQIASLISICLILTGCISSKRHYQRGEYDLAVKKATSKLLKRADKEKEIYILELAYAKAMARDRARIDFLKLEDRPNMWEEVYKRYLNMKNRQSLVNPLIPLVVPSTGKVVDFKLENFDSEIINAKKNATEYHYQLGVELLNNEERTRPDARKAYFEFKNVKRFYPNYKDLNKRMQQAKNLATVKVVVEVSQQFDQQVNSLFFKNEVNNFIASLKDRSFLAFYTQQEVNEMGINDPDHIIQLTFRDFSFSPVRITEEHNDVMRENVFVGIREGNRLKKGADKINICHKEIKQDQAIYRSMTTEAQDWLCHKEHGDYLGNCVRPNAISTANAEEEAITMEEIFGTLRAHIDINQKLLDAFAKLEFKIIDAKSGKAINRGNFTGEFHWQCTWGYFNGDPMALTEDQLAITRMQEQNPPYPQSLFIESSKPIFSQVMERVRTFYNKY